MSFLLDLLGAGGLGTVLSGVSGLIGGWLTKRENRKTLELTNAHELNMAEVDQRAAEFELKASIALAKSKLDQVRVEGETQVDLEAARAFTAGLADANKPTGYAFVDKFRAMTRPLITWSLYLFTIVIFWTLHIKVGGIVAEDTELLVKLYVYLVQSVIYLFIMAVSWWFMSRGDKSAAAIRGLISK
jgi:hypothetical protein